MTSLFAAGQVGTIPTRNRITLAPMTRLRADEDGTPTELIAKFYAQRADFGFLISEGIFPTERGRGYAFEPGLVTDEHVAGWRRVTEAVHDHGGRISAQLMHAGRTSHSALLGGELPVGPSPIAIPGETYTAEGKLPNEVPQALDTAGIREAITAYADAAERAVEAGFDMAEIHGANGYLAHQFIAVSSNERDDEYGGSATNRARFGQEALRAVVERIGADRTGYRVSPLANIQGIIEEDSDETWDAYRALVDEAARLKIAYLSIATTTPKHPAILELISRFPGTVLLNYADFTAPTSLEEAQDLIAMDGVDHVVVGRLGLANPDLPARWESGAALNDPRFELFYAQTPDGYTDYPTLASR